MAVIDKEGMYCAITASQTLDGQRNVGTDESPVVEDIKITAVTYSRWHNKAVREMGYPPHDSVVVQYFEDGSDDLVAEMYGRTKALLPDAVDA